MTHHRPSITDLAVGLLLLVMTVPFALATNADARDRVGHRLYRHQSGYLYGQSRPLALDRRGGYWEGDYGCDGDQGPAPDDDRAQFDARRQALLNHAARVRFSDVSAPSSRSGVRYRPGPKKEDNRRGWDLIASGDSVKALGFFAAQLMCGPGRSEARLGYVLAAAQMGDDAAALVTLRSTLKIDPQSLRAFTVNDEIRPALEALAERYASAEQRTGRMRFVEAAVLEMLDDHDGAVTVLASLPPQADSDQSVRMLRAIAALGIVEMEIAAAPSTRMIALR